jgi:uncharacterized protein YpmB
MYTGKIAPNFIKIELITLMCNFFVKILLSLDLSYYQSMKLNRYHNSEPLQIANEYTSLKSI